jgi:hypothetical protein
LRELSLYTIGKLLLQWGKSFFLWHKIRIFQHFHNEI